MKRVIAAVVFLALMCGGAWAEVKIDAENFPDIDFRAYISRNNFDDDNDGILSDAEIAKITSLQLPSHISSLKGLEYFTSLVRLFLHESQVTELDVSHHTSLVELTCYEGQLTKLNASGCTALTTIYCHKNKLTSLDVSGCTALTTLDCNDNQLTTLDVSSCTALEALYCNDNPLTSLDVSKNADLAHLECRDNQLTVLDVSHNAKLTDLWCDSNQLTSSLDVSRNVALTTLVCGNNQLTTLDLSNNTALTYLSCSDNQLTTLNLVDANRLRNLHCRNNHLAALNANGIATDSDISAEGQTVSPLRITITEDEEGYPYRLDFSDYMSSDKYRNVSAVKGFDSSDVSISSMTSYEKDVAYFAALPSKVTYNYSLSKYREMDVTISGSPDIEINETNFPDDVFRAYVISNFDKDGNGGLSEEEIAAVTEIDVANRKISSLQGVEYFTALRELYCNGNYLTELDVSSCTVLERLECQDNQLSTLKVTHGSTATDSILTYLYCYNNHLTAKAISDIRKDNSTGWWSCSPQSLSPLYVVKAEDYVPLIHTLYPSSSSYPYVVYFDAYDEINSNIESVKGFDSNDVEIPTAAFGNLPYSDYRGYTTMFATIPSKVTYNGSGVERTISGTPESLAIGGAFKLGKVNEAYSESISVPNGHSPYTWSYEGTLPDGTELNQNTSGDTYTLSGKPTKVGKYSFTVSVIDSYYQTASKDITITISVDTPAPTPTPTPTPTPDPKPTPTPEDNNTNTNNTNNTGNNTGNNTNDNTGENTNTPKSLSLNTLENIAKSLGSGSSTPSYIPESNMSTEQAPTSEITREVSSQGYQIVSNQGSLNVLQSGSYAFPISVPYHFIGTRTVAKVFLARRGLYVGMVVNPSEEQEDLIEAQIFTEDGEEVTTLPSTIIAAANIEVSSPTTFSTHLATKVESSKEEIHGTTSGGGCNSGFAVLGLALMGLFRRIK